MTLRVIGAGLGRTGTMSLKLALEQLLGGPCYHMTELFQHPEHLPYWQQAVDGETVDWQQVFGDYVAAVDEPTGQLWEPISQAYPDALIILSVRDPDAWWQSANATIMEVKRQPPPAEDKDRNAWYDMIMNLYDQFYPQGVDEPEAAKAAFRAHIACVKSTVPSERLLVWEAKDGWAPICQALNLPVPDEPFPYSNTREEFIKRRQARGATDA